MNAKELRIGNYVYFPFTKEVVKILGINAHENNGKIENSISFINGENLYCEQKEKLKAIELSNKWLIELGFEKSANTWWLPVGWFGYSDGYFVYGIERMTKIKYVHQIQNLYFSLTGQDLVLSTAVS